MATPSLEATRLAFALHVVRSIVDADEVMTLGELRLVSSRLPTALLHAHGLVDDDGALTPLYEQALDGAAARLAAELTDEEKLELVGLFHRATVADGVLEVAEYQQLQSASHALGLNDATVASFLDGLQTGSDGAPPIRD